MLNERQRERVQKIIDLANEIAEKEQELCRLVGMEYDQKRKKKHAVDPHDVECRECGHRYTTNLPDEGAICPKCGNHGADTCIEPPVKTGRYVPPEQVEKAKKAHAKYMKSLDPLPCCGSKSPSRHKRDCEMYDTPVKEIRREMRREAQDEDDSIIDEIT